MFRKGSARFARLGKVRQESAPSSEVSIKFCLDVLLVSPVCCPWLLPYRCPFCFLVVLPFCFPGCFPHRCLLIGLACIACLSIRISLPHCSFRCFAPSDHLPYRISFPSLCVCAFACILVCSPGCFPHRCPLFGLVHSASLFVLLCCLYRPSVL